MQPSLEEVAERLHSWLHLVLLYCHLEESVDAGSEKPSVSSALYDTE